MAKTLAELLADAAADDNLEFTAADGTKIKLGEVKGFRGAVETERQAAERERKEAVRLAQEAKTIFDSLTAAQGEFEKRKTPPEQKKSRWQDNPLYDELVPVLEAAEKASREAAEMAATNKKELELMTAKYSLKLLREQWNNAPNKPKDKKFEEVVQEVIANKEFDDMGLPTMEKYLHRASEPDRISKAVEEGISKARKEWEKAQRAADIPKPGKFQTRKSAEAPIKNLDELTSDKIANDPEILAAMTGEVQ
jgi:hypothetical protein